jgi:hypothetical protein
MLLLGVAAVLLGTFMMAWSRRLQRIDADGDLAPTTPSVSVFLFGCSFVAIGGVLVADWWSG